MEGGYVCAPKDVLNEDGTVNVFPLDARTRIAVAVIVTFCCERGEGWAPFTYEAIDKFYMSQGFDGHFLFYDLTATHMIDLVGGFYQITPRFVSICYNARER